jgi:hypothetical protein
MALHTNEIWNRLTRFLEEFHTGKGDLKTHQATLRELYDPEIVLEMEDRVMNLADIEKFMEWMHKDPLYTDYKIHQETLLTGGDKLSYHERHNFTPVPGKLFPGTQHVMHNPTRPFYIFGVATFKNGKIVRVEQRSDSLRKAVGVPGDYLDEKSYLNQFSKKAHGRRIKRS